MTSEDTQNDLEVALSRAKQIRERGSSVVIRKGLKAAGIALFVGVIYPFLASFIAGALFAPDPDKFSAQLAAAAIAASVYGAITLAGVLVKSSAQEDEIKEFSGRFIDKCDEVENVKRELDLEVGKLERELSSKMEGLEQDLDRVRKLRNQLRSRLESITDDYRSDQNFLSSITTATEVLVQTLRMPLEKSWSRPTPSVPDLDPSELRIYVLNLLQYCALLLEPDPRQRSIRCGLLFLNAEKSDWFSILTYDPHQDVYISKTKIARDKRPDYLIRRFREYTSHHEGGVGLSKVCYDCIPDTKKFLAKEGRDQTRFSPHTTHQLKYLKSILGVVMYYHDQESQERRPLGILSFDAANANILSEERYQAALPMLRVAYRIMGIRLARICENPTLMQKLYGPPLP